MEEGEDSNFGKENMANIKGWYLDCQKIMSSTDHIVDEDNNFIMVGVDNSIMEEVDKNYILKTMD